jgi:hypothetical protein
VTDVERDDAHGAALEQHVVKPPVDAPMSSASGRHVDVERIEGVRQLDAAAADIRVIGCDEPTSAALSTCVPALVSAWPSTTT